MGRAGHIAYAKADQRVSALRVLTIFALMLLPFTRWSSFARHLYAQEIRKEKRWTKYTEDDILNALRLMASRLHGDLTPSCDINNFGTGWGKHALCSRPPSAVGKPCVFYSFGISNDYSFDLDLADRWSCQGFAADPTVVHPSKLHPNVSFHSIAAKSQTEPPPSFGIVTSIPSLRRWLRDGYVDVLKMDCEGCEYSLGMDVAEEDPTFFNHVGQFAVEVHTSQAWLNSKPKLQSLGLLFLLLEDAGLELQHADITSCHPDDESRGCMDTLVNLKYPCGSGNSCHNYLFARKAST